METRKLKRSITFFVVLLLVSTFVLTYSVMSAPSFSVKRTIKNNVNWARDTYPIDVDNDGDLDCFGIRQGNGITGANYTCWYENDGTMNFTQHSIDTITGMSIAGADFDGDGYAECVGSNYYPDQLNYYDCGSNPEGTWTKQTIISGWDTAYVLSLNDVDNDGELDIVSVAWGSGLVAWFENDGTEHFTYHKIVSLSSPRGMAMGDLDNDGDLDCAVSYASSTIVWYTNDGTPGNDNGWGGSHSVGACNGVTLNISDVNGDGDNDIVCPDNGASRFVWWENNGGGSSFSYRLIANTGSSPRICHPMDIDDDGDTDVFGAVEGNGNIEWYENLNSIGTSWSTHVISSLLAEAVDVHGVDFDQDNDIDVIACDRGTSTGSSIVLDGSFMWFEQLGLPNDPPTFSSEHPTDSSTNNNLALTWNVTIKDPEGDLFNWTIQCNGQTGFSNGASNGSKSLFLGGLSYFTTYTVWVNATDLGSSIWNRATYNFTTIPSVTIQLLSISNESNNSEIFDTTPVFEWTKTGGQLYWLQIANDTAFTDIVVNLSDINDANYPAQFDDSGSTVFFELPNAYILDEKIYYVRVYTSI